VPLRYKVYYSEQALTYSLGLSRKDQVLLAHHVSRLAEKPEALGDYRQEDDAGRPIEVRVYGRHAVLYWLDHAVAKLMVVEIRPADRRS
jgi:hypothetical protein